MIGTIRTMAAFDAGNGPELFAGGEFGILGAPPITGVARWAGSSWAPLPSQIDNTVVRLRALTFAGEHSLFAAGTFANAGGVPVGSVARFDGSSWIGLGTGVGGTASDIVVFDDGSGPALFVGGSFASAGGVPAANIAKWTGSGWSAVGAGLNNSVQTLAVYDDGQGPALVAGGLFTASGITSIARIARWNGVTWSQVGSGFNNDANALIVHQNTLYAAGRMTGTIVVWDGTSWSPFGVGSRPSGVGICLTVADDGAGPQLFAGGDFSMSGSGSSAKAVKYNGVAWEPFTQISNGTVTALQELPATGPRVYAGGTFSFVGEHSAPGFAVWDGAAWSPAASGSTNGTVRSLHTVTSGSEHALYAGGSFTFAGDRSASRIARWDGSEWSALGGGVDGTVYGLAHFGLDIYASGAFTQAGSVSANSIARWDGSDWSALSTGLQGASPNYGYALAVYDDGSGPALFVGGRFQTAGGINAKNIARWNGSAWSAVGNANEAVMALAVFDDGGGAQLYAAGVFTNIGGTPANSIARWNGTSWSALSASAGTAVINSLAVFDDGTGPGLYAGGTFSNLGGTPNTDNIACWRGGTWSALGLGVGISSSFVSSMRAFDDGSGPALYVAGKFTQASGTTAINIARWKGSTWSSVAGGFGPPNSEAFATEVYDEGTGQPRLFVGGTFAFAGTTPSAFLARYAGCPVCYPNCDGSTVSPILNVNDFTCFLNSYAQGQTYANCDSSTTPPVLNVNDFLCFLIRYAAGCP